MCHIYASTDPDRYRCTTRSIRLQGYVTSIRLENEFWNILDSLAGEQEMTTPQFISELYDEVMAERGKVGNHTSMLRVACAVYLKNQAACVAA
ncbi:MAG TPA: ribbon-helix-helix domain-containing protein [Salinisphaeraceae bacterium]|nr:ribbon-helix-helix domain-containing protein [Salinisphaeraceae bacterium]